MSIGQLVDRGVNVTSRGVWCQRRSVVWSTHVQWSFPSFSCLGIAATIAECGGAGRPGGIGGLSIVAGTSLVRCVSAEPSAGRCSVGPFCVAVKSDVVVGEDTAAAASGTSSRARVTYRRPISVKEPEGVGRFPVI